MRGETVWRGSRRDLRGTVGRRPVLDLACLAVLLLVSGCDVGPVDAPADSAPVGEEVTMRLTSFSFSDGGSIPRLHTCDGADTSPALRWEGVPDGAQSLALIVDDPDAPGRTWVHWVLFDIPPSIGMLAEGAASAPGATGGTTGTNSWKRAAYGGPCPPSGEHRYFFKLYALDAVLGLSKTTMAAQLEAAMQGHILATTELMGRYSR